MTSTNTSVGTDHRDGATARPNASSSNEAGGPHGLLPCFGAWHLANGLTRFRLWAPNAAEGVKLEIADREPLPMTDVGDGFYEIQTPCPPGTRYRYRVGPELSVPDPASRLQAGDVHDDSVVTAPDSYAWTNTGWRGRPWRETVLYELHAGLAGGYAGIEAKLPELAALGITAVELMPIADFPGPRNWGYDGVLPYAPDCAYGTPDELKRMIDTAHGLGMMVFLDVVYNHFGPDGNYLSAYASDFFRDDVHTPWGVAIDFRRRAVRQFFAENALYWLHEFRFDGLRLDAVHAIKDVGWLEEMAGFVRTHLPADRIVHLVLENDDNQVHPLENGYQAQWNDDGHHVLHQLLTGESEGYYSDYASHPAQRLTRALSDGFIYQGETSEHRGGPRGEPSAHLPPTSFVLFLQNHDQTGNRAMGERLLALARNDTRPVRAAVALLLLAPQIPLIFMGEERGSTAPFLYFTSHGDAKLAQAVRDGRRKEFEKFRAFAHPETRDRIPDPNDEATYTRSNPFQAPADPEWLDYYQALLQLRQRVVVPRLDGAHSLGAHVLGLRAVVAQWLLGDGAVLSIYVNLGTVDVRPDWLQEDRGDETLLFESETGAGRALRDGLLQHGVTVALLKELA
ncbi:malto-oligosyltrehalose trehalohydrolase [Bordetella genomosp. 8]|uniref:Malto-oligosyltrehalose trehalohydrolase n=1 Tax=Bordetella genomosp. 8 TaxID=1416806 RepID=A0A1W6YM58_9BORD|nr:malto-oligosyltrehalose trehalohydrolase [Bordetella genomosp. 8]ARP82196.1 malto-oligosyltrehalose trehalohydrolase [Bordetella genomosp. 8]